MKKIITIIFDGFGIREEEKGNAVKLAKLNNFNNFFEHNPHTLLDASEEAVGLLKGQVGNSEIGHQTIGAGRVIKSSMSKINELLNENVKSDVLDKFLSEKEKRVHLMGLCSDGNVHASVEHFISMYNLLIKNGFTKIYFHLITDGRDTKINVSQRYIKAINKLIEKNNIGKISTVCGRFYAMDRDENYDRTKRYYDLITKGVGQNVNDIYRAIESSYQKDITDEFIEPMVLSSEGLIRDNDTIVWLNYRQDRSKQILRTFVDHSFNAFDTVLYQNIDVYTFFEVDSKIKTNYFIKNEEEHMPLGIYFSKLGLKQARISESEKFPHVTYFFDGGFDGKLPNCDKFLVASPEVETYDLKPEMSAVGVAKKAIECIQKDYDFILVNFANPDMVGHTGNLEAAKKACLTVDLCLGKILEVAHDNFYKVVLLADHGNADTMINSDGSICTTHSLAKVPFVIEDSNISFQEGGSLANVAPTLLDYLDITIPEDMDEKSILIEG